ncbi:MAG: hypothetical protein AAF741_05540 [Bacteroidota bacterium]
MYLLKLRKSIIIILLLSFHCSREVENSQISQKTDKITFKNGFTIYANKYSYGLNGQHRRLSLSSDSITKGMVLKDVPYFTSAGGHILYFKDTLPKPILYSTIEPENMNQLNQWSDSLEFQLISGSERYWLSKSESTNLISISY